MKAAYITNHGGPEVFRYGDVPDPTCGPADVVVNVHAASVNAADWKMRAGGYTPITRFPYVLGRDFSGVVVEAGPNADLKPGDAVFGVLPGGQEGTYAEKLAVEAAVIARKPDPLTHVEAAALGLAGLTALVAVVDTLQIKTGETILVQGGAGGVASVAIQIARSIGAKVASTASAANLDYVRGLGADPVIDYAATDFTEALSGLDAVFDTVGGDVAMRSFAVLKPGGRAAFIASGPQAPESPRDDVASLRPAVGRDRAHLDRLVELVAKGAVRVPEIRTFGLSEAAKAHVISEGRHFRGKLVFQVK